MNILHVCDSIPGGTGSYLAELLPLQAAVHGPDNITLLAPEQHRGHLEQRLVDSGIALRFFDRPSRAAGMAKLAREYLAIRRQVRPDIVHAHSFGAGFIARTQPHGGARIVFCPHGWAFDMDVKPAIRKTIITIERVLAIRTVRIVLISRHEEERAKQVGIGEDKLRVVVNGIDARLPDGKPADWVDNRLKLLFVGRFDRQKGLDILMAAIAPLGDRVTLRTVGAPVVPGARATFPSSPFVTHLGWRSREEVAAQIAACDLLVVPSRWEGFGLVAIEAMRQGKPVMAAAVGGLKEITGAGRYGFSIPPDNVLAWRATLSELNRETMDRIASAGSTRFHECYTADRMAAQLDDLYVECVRKPGLPLIRQTGRGR